MRRIAKPFRLFVIASFACGAVVGVVVTPPSGLVDTTYGTPWMARGALALLVLLFGLALSVVVHYGVVQGQPPTKLGGLGESLEYSDRSTELSGTRAADAPQPLEPARQVDERLLGRIEQVTSLVMEGNMRVGSLEARIAVLEARHSGSRLESRDDADSEKEG